MKLEYTEDMREQGLDEVVFEVARDVAVELPDGTQLTRAGWHEKQRLDRLGAGIQIGDRADIVFTLPDGTIQHFVVGVAVERMVGW